MRACQPSARSRGRSAAASSARFRGSPAGMPPPPIITRISVNPAATVSFAFASVSSGVVRRIEIDRRTDAGSRPAFVQAASSALLRATPSSKVPALECHTSACRAVRRSIRSPFEPIQIAGHIQTHPRALRDRGHRAEHGPPVEDRCGGIGTERDEVIEGPDMIEAPLVTDTPNIYVDVNRMYLLRELEAVPKRVLW